MSSELTHCSVCGNRRAKRTLVNVEIKLHIELVSDAKKCMQLPKGELGMKKTKPAKFHSLVLQFPSAVIKCFERMKIGSQTNGFNLEFVILPLT